MLLFNFLYWHYVEAWLIVVEAWFNFCLLPFHLFSTGLLFKTLFSPWRRVSLKQKNGFSFTVFFQTLTFNLISRGIAFIVRFFLIIVSLINSLVFFILGLSFFVLWPFLFPLSLFLYVVFNLKSEKKQKKDFFIKRLGVEDEQQLKKIDKKKLFLVEQWYQQYKKKKTTKKQFWKKENLFQLRSFGSSLCFGYTPKLDQYSQDLSFPPPFAHQLVGRKKEIKLLETGLTRKSQTNVLLVGEPGVGKQTIVMGLARAVRQKKIHRSLFYKRILLLDVDAVLSRRTEQENKVKFKELLEEAIEAGNVILVINQIEKYLSNKEGIDLGSVFVQISQNKRVQLIGITTPSAFEEIIFPQEEIIKYFEKIDVSSPSKKEALNILQQVLPDFEKGTKTTVTLEALQEIIEKSDKLISHIPFPEKAIDILDELVNQAVVNKKSKVDKKDVHQILSQKTKVPIGALSKDEKEKLKNLEQILHRRIISQNKAVKSLTSAMQRARVGVSDQNKPIGVFLFLGPTGVGKTETAKALAENFFGSEKRIIRFDMGQPFDFSNFVKTTRENPFAVLLLDEFEKAGKETQHLFLPVFDEGYLKDQHGKKVSFKNMIIICTSNAGSEFIRKEPVLNQEAIIDYVLKKGFFSPELINRFDGVIVYHFLKIEEVEQIARLLIGKLKKRMAEKKIVIDKVDKKVYKEIARQGYSSDFGARPLKRLISNEIESLIARKMLDGEIVQGSVVNLTITNNNFDIDICN